MLVRSVAGLLVVAVVALVAGASFDPRQLIEFLWPEIHKWALQADWWKVGLEIQIGRAHV